MNDLHALLNKLQEVQDKAQHLADPETAYREGLNALLEAIVEKLEPDEAATAPLQAGKRDRAASKG
jgi:hypothetical protein